MTEWLPIVIGSALGPLITWAVKKIPVVEESGSDKLGAAINLIVCQVLFIAVGAILPRLYPELPRELETWVQLGLAAAGVGQAGNNLWKKAILAPEKPAEKPTPKARKKVAR